MKMHCHFITDISYRRKAAPISAMSGIVEASENRTSRLLFKLAVELSMLMNLYAAQSDVGEEILEKLRGKCIQDVKHTNGSVNLESVMAYQKGK